jgi:hypothetical protein
VGIAAHWIPILKLDREDVDDAYGLGHEIAAHLAVEAVIPTTTLIYFPVRAMAGPLVIIPKQELKSERKAMERLCDDPAAADAFCDSAGTPVVGLSAGGSVGGIIAAHRVVHLRGDLIFQYVSAQVMSQRITDSGDEIDAAVQMLGYRLWLSAAMEFGARQ